MSTSDGQQKFEQLEETTFQQSPVVRNAGLTPSEKYLAALSEKTFLNLWSYPSPFIDKKIGGKGDGKELCDLLVACGRHILIFSDKSIEWPHNEDIQVSWKRWYKRAIKNSAEQIMGAARWINMFPDRIFLDKECKIPLPIDLPDAEHRKIHGIIVALGAGRACIDYFGDGIGSLLVAPHVRGDDHWKPENVEPFAVGDVNPSGSFIHVLDDATLDIALNELDTISDFTSYLSKKEEIVRSQKLVAAGGEEDLIAYYMSHMNYQDEHDFTRPDGLPLGPKDHIAIQPGTYTNFIQHPQYQAKKLADKTSYVWDSLIETFTNHMLAGTTIVPEGEVFRLKEHELAVRYMALVPRHMRRMLGDGILDALSLGKTADRFTRGFLPHPNSTDQETGFFFMTLSPPAIKLEGGYSQYRQVRRSMLETYALAFHRRHPKLKRIIGAATEPPSGSDQTGSSEDLILAEVNEWTDDLLADLKERQQLYRIIQDGNYSEYVVHGNEYPEAPMVPVSQTVGSPNRQQRRAMKAKKRRATRKGIG